MHYFDCGSCFTRGAIAIQICRKDRRYYVVFGVKPSARPSFMPVLAVMDDFGSLVSVNALHTD